MHMGGEVNILEAWRERISLEIGFSESARVEWPEHILELPRYNHLRFVVIFLDSALILWHAQSCACQAEYLLLLAYILPPQQKTWVSSFFCWTSAFVQIWSYCWERRQERPWRDPMLWLVGHASSPGALNHVDLAPYTHRDNWEVGLEGWLQKKILICVIIWWRNRNCEGNTAITHHYMFLVYHLLESFQGWVRHHKWPLKPTSV